MKTLNDLNFSNRFTQQLPADPLTSNARRQVANACYSSVSPTEVSAPTTAAYSSEVAELIGLDPSQCDTLLFADVFGGNKSLPGMDPFAMCYGGHQFGNWAGQLGDGRAINLGEVVTDAGRHFTLQLKGSGPTPYSRTADGLAVLRSSLREFLCSEAMFHLGVPTTRALSLVLTGERVRRDMFYDGNPQWEPGAVVCRVAPSFIRFGSFQIFAARKDPETLRKLIDFTIRNDFPEFPASQTGQHTEPTSNETVNMWFREICRLTAEMIVHWQRVGFVHGVMNTDNMSILGLTIDYGPYGWLEGYDEAWTPNTTDSHGRRYRFGNQPTVAHWNLYQLANALVQITEDPSPLEESLEFYAEYFNRQHYLMMANKLGLERLDPDSDQTMIDDLPSVLESTETDMTIFFRRLGDLSPQEERFTEIPSCLLDAYYKPEDLQGEVLVNILGWLNTYAERISDDSRSQDARRASMNKVNPKYVLRNYMAQVAIDQSENGDHAELLQLLQLLREPYDEQLESEDQYFQKRPEWARQRAGCSMLSCSS